MLKKIVLTASLIFVFLTVVNAQKKPSDIRKEKLEQQASNKVFDEKDQFFNVKDIPEKWKNESAVILAQKYKYEYTADGSKLNFTEVTRKKVKLLDKAAVEEFSKFYFYKTSDDHKVGIRIIKADGTIKNISTSDAVKVTSEIPGFFRSSIYGFRVEYNKIAIGDLEPGDIIDFFQEVHGSGFNWTGGAQTFSPILYTLQDEYPILKQKLDFIAEKGYFFNFKSLNGAPEIKKNAMVDRRTSSFSMEDSDRERVKDVRWLYSLRRLPSVKFQVVYAKIGAETEQFLGKVGEPKQSVTPQEIAEKVSYQYYQNASFAGTYADEIETWMRKKHKTVKEPMEYLKYAYYYLRHRTFINNYMSKGVYLGDDDKVNNAYFVAILRELLKNKKVDSKVVVTAPRAVSDIDDVVMYDEVRWILKVGDKYLYPYNPNSVMYEPDESIEGTNAYIIEVNRREKDSKFEKTVLPVSKAADNAFINTFDVKIDDNMENMVVNSKVTTTGLMKSGSVYVLKNTDYVDEDWDIYGGERPEEEVTRNKTKLAEIERKEQARVEEQKKEKSDQMKEALGSDFKTIVSYDNFTLDETGRSSEKPELIYNEKYTLGDMVKKAGPNYSVDIAALIGSQVDIKSKEKERDYDIFLNYPKTIDYTISFTIPANYKVEGLESLKFNVDNNTGSFVSTTELKGDVLKITAKKVYKSNYVKKEDWAKMVEFLDAAYNFSAKKVILKKK